MIGFADFVCVTERTNVQPVKRCRYDQQILGFFHESVVDGDLLEGQESLFERFLISCSEQTLIILLQIRRKFIHSLQKSIHRTDKVTGIPEVFTTLNIVLGSIKIRLFLETSHRMN